MIKLLYHMSSKKRFNELTFFGEWRQGEVLRLCLHEKYRHITDENNVLSIFVTVVRNGELKLQLGRFMLEVVKSFLIGSVGQSWNLHSC